MEQLSKVKDVQKLVNIFMKAEGFKSHRRHNADELTITYAHMY